MNNISEKVDNTSWLPIKGYEGLYEINKQGIIKSLKRKTESIRYSRTVNERFLKPRLNNFGYAEVRLSKKGVPKTRFIHVLMSETFIPNPHRKPEVNHKNGIKDDNRLENLEWVTHAENMRHAYKIGLIKPKGRPVIDTCSGKEYANTRIAALKNGLNYYALRSQLYNKRKSREICLQFKNAA